MGYLQLFMLSGHLKDDSISEEMKKYAVSFKRTHSHHKRHFALFDLSDTLNLNAHDIIIVNFI